MNTTRRRFLGAAAMATVGALAGCTGVDPGGGGGGDGTDPDRLTLPTLDVRGSPGGDVVVKPAGEVALLDFFATWCAPCKPQMKELNAVLEEFPDLHLVSITTENDEAAIKQFWREYDGTWPVARDPELAATQRYEARQMPTMIILDADGTETWRHVGLAAADTVAEKLREAGA